MKETTKILSRLARESGKDFRANTSLDTIIQEYESRIKELEKQ